MTVPSSKLPRSVVDAGVAVLQQLRKKQFGDHTPTARMVEQVYTAMRAEHRRLIASKKPCTQR